MSQAGARPALRRYGGFLFTGSIGFCTDLGVLTLLTAAGWGPLVARIPSVLIAVTVTWLLNRQITFATHAPPSFAEFGRYLAVSAVTVLVNYAVYGGFVLAGVTPPLALAAASGISMTLSYCGYGHLVFRRKLIL
jgi:putative flippase GtrA